jgi:hypothetical protein
MMRRPRQRRTVTAPSRGRAEAARGAIAKRGKDATQFAGALAALAARSVWNGRRACGNVGGNDVMSAAAQRRHNFRVEALPSTRQSRETLFGIPRGQQIQDSLEERLANNTRTLPPKQAAFRIDFPAWLKTLTPRERCIIRAMALSERTKELSRRFSVSPGRISQMRREFRDDWRRFVGDELVKA